MTQKARAQLESKSLGEVADWMHEHWNNPACQIAASAEFLRRQTLAQQVAAKAATETAEHTRRNARYLLWSIGAILLSSIVLPIDKLL